MKPVTSLICFVIGWTACLWFAGDKYSLIGPALERLRSGEQLGLGGGDYSLLGPAVVAALFVFQSFTMADVARRAGVATSTVSYVVSGTRTVSPETRERVLHTIAETGYEPDTLARALRRIVAILPLMPFGVPCPVRRVSLQPRTGAIRCSHRVTPEEPSSGRFSSSPSRAQSMRNS